MNVKIAIRTKTTIQDAELNAVETWGTWKTVWAQPLEKTSRAFYRMNQQNAEISRLFRIRYLAGVTSQMQIVFGSETLSIIGPPENEGERNESLLIACKGMM
jgi:SPP1 family predicted phage head-tail adaptor